MNPIKIYVKSHFSRHSIIYMICVFGLIVMGMMRLGNVNADNEPVDLIALHNQQIDEIDHKMQENSKAFNDAQVTIDAKLEIQTQATSGNNALRAEKAKIEAQKASVIAGNLK